MEMSPHSLEGRRTAETLEMQMGRRSMGEYMRSLATVLGSDTPAIKPIPPLVTPAMMDETMRAVKQRHPRSSFTAEDPTIATVARGLATWASGMALPDPPTPRRLAPSPTHHPEESEVIDVDELNSWREVMGPSLKSAVVVLFLQWLALPH